jgi:hypothetical protein
LAVYGEFRVAVVSCVERSASLLRCGGEHEEGNVPARLDPSRNTFTMDGGELYRAAVNKSHVPPLLAISTPTWLTGALVGRAVGHPLADQPSVPADALRTGAAAIALLVLVRGGVLAFTALLRREKCSTFDAPNSELRVVTMLRVGNR